jgi:hypothetical protein
VFHLALVWKDDLGCLVTLALMCVGEKTGTCGAWPMKFVGPIGRFVADVGMMFERFKIVEDFVQ